MQMCSHPDRNRWARENYNRYAKLWCRVVEGAFVSVGRDRTTEKEAIAARVALTQKAIYDD